MENGQIIYAHFRWIRKWAYTEFYFCNNYL